MDYTKLTVLELEEKFVSLWNRADKLPNGSKEYDEIVDEVLAIRRHCIENHIELSREVEARF